MTPKSQFVELLEIGGTLTAAFSLVGVIYGSDIFGLVFLLLGWFSAVSLALIGLIYKWPRLDTGWTIAAAAILFFVGMADIFEFAIKIVAGTPK
jgi:hypothetical protein